MTISINKGDTSCPVFIRPDLTDPEAVIDATWKCHTSVEDVYGNVVIAEREITVKTDDNKHFVVYVEDSESATLDTGSIMSEYVWVIRLSNAQLEPDYVKEKRITLSVYR